MDTSTLVKGADLSHYQLDVDFDQLVADGVKFVIPKATQGLAVDKYFDINVNKAAKHNLLCFVYPFLTLGDNKAIIDNFLKVTDGMVPAYDWERHGVSSTIVEQWIDAYESKTNRDGLMYYGLYPPSKVTPKIASWPRWLPEYSSHPKIPLWDGKSKPNWQYQWLIWQYTGNGHLDKINGAIDLNYLATDLDTLKVWHDTGKFPSP